MRRIASDVHVSETDETFPFCVSYDTSNATVNHWHKEMEILYVAEGSMPTYINGVLYHLHKGDVALIVSGDVHGILYSDPERIVVIYQLDILKNKYFDDENIYELMSVFDRLQRVSPLWPDEVKAAMITLIFSLRDMWDSGDRGTEYKIKVKSLLTQLTELFWDKIPRGQPQKGEMTLLHNKTVLEKLNKVFLFICDHYTEGIKIKDAADLLGISDSHFIKFWKKYSNISFHTYLNEYRTDRAIRLLLETDESVSQICFLVGFQNLKTFNRIFKSVTGTTPSAYRKEKTLPSP